MILVVITILQILCAFIMVHGATGPPAVLGIELIRGGAMDGFDLQKSADFVVGKDRELIHASIDLKWLFDTLSDKGTWIHLLESFTDKVHRLHPGYDAECIYRDHASRIMRDIHDLDPKGFNLRIFQQSIHTAQSLASSKERPILFYCEEESDDVIPTLPTFLMRRALASKSIGSSVNSKFIFMACYHHHKYAQLLLDMINGDPTRPNIKPPFILALHPRFSTAQTSDDRSSNAENTEKNMASKKFIALPSLKFPSFQTLQNSLSLDIGSIFIIPEQSRSDKELTEYLNKVLSQQESRDFLPSSGPKSDSGENSKDTLLSSNTALVITEEEEEDSTRKIEDSMWMIENNNIK